MSFDSTCLLMQIDGRQQDLLLVYLLEMRA